VFAPDLHMFFAGDTGYSRTSATSQSALPIASGAGGFDIALIPVGAYEPRWFMAQQHVDPSEAVRMHLDLRAKRSLGIHWGTFELSDEALDQPPLDLAVARRTFGVGEADFFVLAIGQTAEVATPQRRTMTARGGTCGARPPRTGRMKKLIAVWAAWPHCHFWPGAAEPGAVVTTPQVRAELVAHAPEGVAPGKPLWLGLKIEHQPHWHTYWKNPGDSGLPTTLNFTLPGGVQAGPVQWPTPGRLPIGPLMNYGYDGTLLLPVAVTVPAGFAAEALDIKLQAEWLVCKDVCIPESANSRCACRPRPPRPGMQRCLPPPRPRCRRPCRRPGHGAASRTVRCAAGGRPARRVAGQGAAFFPETTGVIQTAAVPQGAMAGGHLDGAGAAGPAAHRLARPCRPC
jgi:hypothetical protein